MSQSTSQSSQSSQLSYSQVTVKLQSSWSQVSLVEVKSLKSVKSARSAYAFLPASQWCTILLKVLRSIINTGTMYIQLPPTLNTNWLGRCLQHWFYAFFLLFILQSKVRYTSFCVKCCLPWNKKLVISIVLMHLYL